MKYKKSNVFAVIVILAFIVCCFNFNVFADVTEWDMSVNNDGSVMASFDSETKTLTVTGTGAIKDVSYYGQSELSSIRSNVEHLVIGEGITIIGEGAFSSSYYNWGLSNLLSIELPSTLTNIKSNAFRRIGNVSVTIPNGVTSIGVAAFANSNLTSVSFQSGSDLTSIGQEAFTGCSYLTEIHIPNGVTTIGSEAFRNCSSLTTLELPSTITSIGSSAFHGCPSVSSLTWETETTPTLGNYALGYTYSGTNQIIGYNAVSKTATLDADNKYLIDLFEANNFTVTEVDDDGLDPYLSYPSSAIYTLGSNVMGYYNAGTKTLDVIGTGAMTNFDSYYGSTPLSNILNDVEVLNISEGITTIGNYVFYYAYSSTYCLRNVTSITLPSTLTSIGMRAFQSAGFTSVTIPSGVISIGDYAFSGCAMSSLSFETDSSLTTIGESAFASCANLQNVSLPTSITTIGNTAFNNDTQIKTIVWPIETTPTFGTNVFGSYSSTIGTNATGKTATIDADNAYLIALFENLGYVVSTVDNDGLNPYASYPSSAVYNYGANVSGYYNSYTGELVLVGTGAMDDFYTGYMGYGHTGPDAAPSEPINASRIVVSEGITHIGDNAFSYSIGVPSGHITTRRPSSLTELVLPSTLESIGDGAFNGASNLDTLILPEGLESIGDSAFSDAASLELLSIPSTVDTIGSNAFGGTHSNLITVYNYAEDSQTLGDTVMGSTTGIDYVLYSTNASFDTQIKAISPNTITYLDTAYPTSGDLENGVHWEYDDETHTLSFSGDGEVGNQTGGEQPWYGAATAGGGIANYSFGTGITGIGSNVFGYYGGNTNWGYGGNYGGVSTYSPSGLASSIAGYAPQASNAERLPEFGDEDNEVANPGDSGSAYIILDAQTTIFKAVVPIKVNVSQSADGSVSVLGEYYISNLGPAGPIIIDSCRLVMKTGWSISAYTDDYTNKPADSRILGLQMNGANFNTDGTITLNSSLSSSILHGASKALTFGAKLSAHKNPISNENIAAIIFTLDFDKAV